MVDGSVEVDRTPPSLATVTVTAPRDLTSFRSSPAVAPAVPTDRPAAVARRFGRLPRFAAASSWLVPLVGVGQVVAQRPMGGQGRVRSAVLRLAGAVTTRPGRRRRLPDGPASRAVAGGADAAGDVARTATRLPRLLGSAPAVCEVTLGPPRAVALA